ncbi:MAG: Lon family ATP-dependent protease [Chloroflexota bacterium]
MKAFLEKFIRTDKSSLGERLGEEEQLNRQVGALFGLLSHLYGADKLILRAGKLQALAGIKSSVLEERVLALQKIVYEDPTLETPPTRDEVPGVLDDIEEEIADIIARRTVEEKIEKKIAERMQQKHEEYVREIKTQIMKEDQGPETPATEQKLERLNRLDSITLSRTALEVLRPSTLAEVVGQDRAIAALLAKIASPYPQHVLLYGPPGTGKTTVARLVLEEAKRLGLGPFKENAPFVEVDGTTLRWDPREITNPLLGSVHDPIYQGARRDLADGGVPEPKLGLVTDAHGGVLFIDEVGELDPLLQNKLLKVLEDKRVMFESSYYDPDDPSVPAYVRKLFSEGAPADFVLIGATTREPESITPAIRSRCTGVFFEPLTPADIEVIVRNAAKKLDVNLDPKVPRIIAEYTIEGRKAVNLLADAYGLALYLRARRKGARGKAAITTSIVYEVLQMSRLSPQVNRKASDSAEVAKIFGLGVAGYIGSAIEIEAVAFPAREKGKGAVRFNDTAGSMAKDSVFNATSVIRKLTDLELADYDLHVNVVGGGQIDGPSAGAAILLVILSALQGRPIRQDVAVTGELSIQGKLKAVGGIAEKIYGAKQAGIKRVIVPSENAKDVPAAITGIEVIPVSDVEEAIALTMPPALAESRAV